MPHDKKTATVEGEITNVFAHRIVVRTKSGSVLADLGPKGAEKAAPKEGDTVKLSGEQKPSELKVTLFEKDGRSVEIENDHDEHHEPADPEIAKAAVEKLGHTMAAAPHRKPKHFEVLAKDAKGDHHEHHVELDGKIKKSKEGDPKQEKWQPKPARSA